MQIDDDATARRATRWAAAASMGTLLSMAGFFADGGASAATVATSTTAAPSTEAPATAAATTTAAPTTAAPTTVTPTTSAPCTNTYTVLSGDYWLLLAQESGLTVDELYAANDADATTPLFPGDQLCLPDGASVSTTAVATTVRAATPATTAASTTAATSPAVTPSVVATSSASR